MVTPIAHKTAAVLIIDNQQGFEIDDNVLACFGRFPKVGELFKIPASLLDNIGLIAYYPSLAKGYDYVYASSGHDPDRAFKMISDATEHSDNVDVYVMKHSNMFDGTRIASNSPIRFLKELTPMQRQRLGNLYSMGCEDGSAMSGVSAHIMGFKTFVGHEGISPNFLFTGAFIEHFIGEKKPIREAADMAYEDAKATIDRLPESALCAYYHLDHTTAKENIRPFVDGPYESSADFQLASLYAKIISGGFRGEEPSATMIGGIFDDRLSTEKREHHEFHDDELKGVELLGAYGAREMLMNIARNEELSDGTRWTAIDQLVQLKLSEREMLNIVEDPTQKMSLRNKALQALLDMKALPAVISLLLISGTDPELLLFFLLYARLPEEDATFAE